MLKPLIAALVFVLSVPAQAQEAPPPAGEPKNFNIAEPTTLKLDNGLNLTLVPFGNVPKITVEAVVRAGELNAEGRTGLTDLLAEMMYEGAGDRDASALALKAADMGGELNISIDDDQTTVSIDVLADFAAPAIALIADVVRAPRLPEDAFERVRQNQLRNLSVSRSQPAPLAREAFHKALYGDHAYGDTLPTEDALNAFTLDELREFHEREFGAQRTHIYVSGQFDPAAIRSAVEANFVDWDRGFEAFTDIPAPAREMRVRLINRPGAPQSTIYLGIPVADASLDESVPLSVMNTLLGGSFISRITANIREDKGYTYSPRSRITQGYRVAHFVQVADVATNATGLSLIEIFKEINRLRAEAPSAEELKLYQNYMSGVFVLRNASPSGLIGQLSNINFHGLPRSRLTNFVADVHAVTPEDVRLAAETYIDPAHMTLVVVGDLSTVEDQLKDVPALKDAPFEIVE